MTMPPLMRIAIVAAIRLFGDRLRSLTRPAAIVHSRYADGAHGIHADGHRQGRSRRPAEQWRVHALAAGKFRWSWAKPYRQLIVGDGERVWIYDEDLNQVVVRKAGEAIAARRSAACRPRDASARSSGASFRPKVAWSARRDAAGRRTPAFAEIRLGFDAKSLAALELNDAFGQKTVVRFGESTAIRRSQPTRSGSSRRRGRT